MKHILHESVWVKTQAKHTEEIGNSIIFTPLVPPPHDTVLKIRFNPCIYKFLGNTFYSILGVMGWLSKEACDKT